jgi:hypothetical protein
MTDTGLTRLKKTNTVHVVARWSSRRSCMLCTRQPKHLPRRTWKSILRQSSILVDGKASLSCLSYNGMDVIEFVEAPAHDHSGSHFTSVSQLQSARIIGYISSTLSSSIGGLVVKLAVAIQDLQIYDVGQPRVRFPADA